MRASSSSASPSPSSTTATGLPRYAVSVNTSTWRKRRCMAAELVRIGPLGGARFCAERAPWPSGERLGQGVAGEGDGLGVVRRGDQVDHEAVEADLHQLLQPPDDLVLIAPDHAPEDHRRQ